MSSAYLQLLDATIAHLETLKGLGVGWVPVRRDTLLSIVSPSLTPLSSVARRDIAKTVRPAFQNSQSPSIPTENFVSASPQSSVVPPAVRSEAAMSRWSKAVAVVPPTSSSSKTSFVAAPLPSPLPPEARAAAMAELRSQILACTRCSHLAASRQSVVFGVGDIHSKILFVGEAPGVEEDLSGEPFAGPAGDLLTKILTAMGLGRESVFITNLLKCRPDTPGDSAGNRKPKPDEVSTCIPWLERQIDLVQPRVVVALGASAVEGLLGKGTAGISQLRGSWQNYRGMPLMPTYHPAYLLRNLALSEKRKVWEDMLQVMERAGYPVSTKQRGFFLTKD
ncbi:MAG: uracil-DNA glycosylase [Verrucomicrobia bacterium]|nr:uracil-DNA glycosylase [Verrucomicrobiota bacterium]